MDKFRRYLDDKSPISFTRTINGVPHTISGVVLDDCYYPDGVHTTLVRGDDGVEYNLYFRTSLFFSRGGRMGCFVFYHYICHWFSCSHYKSK